MFKDSCNQTNSATRKRGLEHKQKVVNDSNGVSVEPFRWLEGNTFLGILSSKVACGCRLRLKDDSDRQSVTGANGGELTRQ